MDDSNEAELIRVIASDLTALTQSGSALEYTSYSGTDSIALTDQVVLVNNTAAATMTLPNAASVERQYFTIKDANGNAETYNIIIDTVAGTIDGNASLTMSVDYMSLTIYSDGTNYYIL
jgi:hypothetical protein